MLCGCSITVTPEVSTTQQWENHYMTVDDFKEGTKDITLKDGQSIWVLSNDTLSRVLKNSIEE